MPTHIRDPHLYLNDRNIHDGLRSTRRATSSVLLQIARERGLILSELEPHDDLVRYISQLTHSWHDLKTMVDLLSTSERADRWSQATLPFKKSSSQVNKMLQALQDQQAAARDEVWNISRTKSGMIAVEISYKLPDFSKSAMTQLTSHTCRLEFTCESGQILVRHKKQERAEQLIAVLLGRLNDDADSSREVQKIELSDVQDNRLRSEFFTALAESLPGFRLVEVPSVRGNNGMLSKTPTASDRKAAAAIQSAIRRVSLLGRSITKTSEYRQFFEASSKASRFYLTSMVWVSDDASIDGIRVEFEASFTSQADCSGFVYRVRKVWHRIDGVLRRTPTAPAPNELQRLNSLLEAHAREVCHLIKSKAGVEAEARPSRSAHQLRE